MDKLADKSAIGRSSRRSAAALTVPDVVVVTGSAALAPAAVAALPDGAVVIAADGALDRALEAGLHPAGLVGDLDSVSEAGLAWAVEHATIDRHDPDKDRTDTELALALAVDLNPDRLTLVGAGTRLDHTLGALGALGHPTLTSIPRIEAWWADQHLFVVHGPGRLALQLPEGTTISLLAMHGACTGVGIDGVRWPLHDTVLAPMVGHGISNVTTSAGVAVRVSTGVLTVLLVEPGAE
jgi:thiamine pyrophosphokinase